MIQGTTPTHIFRLPIATRDIDQLRITYAQYGKTVLEVTEADVTMDVQDVKYRLSQGDSLKFKPQTKVEVQIKVLTADGNVMASPVMLLTVEKILNTEVLA